MKVLKTLASALCLAGSLLLATAHAADLPRSKPEAEGLSSARLSRITATLMSGVNEGRIPGAVLVVGRHGKVVQYDAVGDLGPVPGLPMQRDAIFRIYSMSKPVTSVAAMILVEEGRMKLEDPVSRYIPSFGQVQVGVEKPGLNGAPPTLALEPARRPITVHDLLRHTSGLTYGFFGNSLVRTAYDQAHLLDDLDNAGLADRLASLPLAAQPGTTWDYSHSTDVLGRVIEVVSGQRLGEFLQQRLFEPLGMKDTSFYVTDRARQGRIAEPFEHDRNLGLNADMGDPRVQRKGESGGGGLVSTAMDFARFAQMLRNGGTLDGQRILSPKTIAFMTSDHVGANIIRTPLYLPGPGYGFGLGFAVRTAAGEAVNPSEPGTYHWNGAAGTLFWVDPKTDLWVVLMIQSIKQRDHYRSVLMNMIYGSVIAP
ncbi:serine hydrolase domain-containing protein [Ideonella sp. DXS29W]|uniref:Serine hydrolase domain-containing protein n=1 Tax=Ideonella lacteola TaxID=2984193 RepID=A0ABU9BZG6_9BURK